MSDDLRTRPAAESALTTAAPQPLRVPMTDDADRFRSGR